MTTKIVVDCSTGVVDEIALTDDELAQQHKDRLAFEKAEQERLAEEASKAAKRQELLARLGLTEEEAKLLLA